MPKFIFRFSPGRVRKCTKSMHSACQVGPRGITHVLHICYAFITTTPSLHTSLPVAKTGIGWDRLALAGIDWDRLGSVGIGWEQTATTATTATLSHPWPTTRGP